jgi:hypothetical protein
MKSKTKVLLVGPLCNISGYSEHARTIMDALIDMQDEIDLYVQVTQWASSTWDTNYNQKYKHFIDKSNKLFMSRRDAQGNVALDGFFDASFQVKPPNEFQKISNNDVGVTAALETTFAPVEWIPRCNLMKHIFVVSEHAKQNLKNTKDQHGNTIGTPITVIPYDCYLTLTHGEGFGIPIFHAACNSIPIIATNWSGHLDFLRAPFKNKAGNTKLKSHFLRVDYDISKVHSSHLMPNLITPDCEWAYPRESSYKKNLKLVRMNYENAKREAENLQTHLLDKFSSINIHNMYKDQIRKLLPETSKLQNDVEKMFASLSLED